MARIGGDVPPTGEDPAPTEASHAELMYTVRARHQPVPRLDDMDADGIDIAVLYPTLPGLMWVPEPDVFHTMAQEYNRWLHEYCSATRPARAASGWWPCRTLGLAVKEMERCVHGSRLQGGHDPPGSVHREQEAERPGVRPVLGRRGRSSAAPIGVHPFSFHDMPWNVVTRLGLAGRRRGPSRQGTHAAPGTRQRARRDGGDGLVRGRRHLRAVPGADRGVPRRLRWLVRADVGALRPPRRRVRQPLPDDAAVGGLQAAVLHQLRSRRGGTRVHAPTASTSAPIASCGHRTTRTRTPRSPASSTSSRRRPRRSTDDQRRLIFGENAERLCSCRR